MYRIGSIFILAAMLLVGAASLAQAADNNAWYWNGSESTSWSNNANWTPTTFGGSGLWWTGGSVINNGGTVTIANGDNVTDSSGNDSSNGGSGQGNIFVGGSSGLLGGNGGSGYVTMSGGTLSGGASYVTEVLGVDAGGSGIFAQSGGINAPYMVPPQGQNILNPGTFSSLQLGYSKGGYGEYDMSAGSLQVNVINVGGNNAGVLNAGTGVFTQTGGSVGIWTSQKTQPIGLMVGGNWTTTTVLSATPITYSSFGTYTLGNAGGTGSPLFVGGCEAIGVTGTGTFTQNCGTNAIVGGGDFGGKPGTQSVPYNSQTGALLLGWYGGPNWHRQGRQGALSRPGRGDIQPQRWCFDRWPAVLVATAAWRSSASAAQASSIKPAGPIFPLSNSTSVDKRAISFTPSRFLLAQPMEPTTSALVC